MSDRRSITIDDDENRRLHATWSRSGKRSDAHQVELRPEQVEELIQFLGATLASDAADR